MCAEANRYNSSEPDNKRLSVLLHVDVIHPPLLSSIQVVSSQEKMWAAACCRSSKGVPTAMTCWSVLMIHA
jgi:hypothetical protein